MNKKQLLTRMETLYKFFITEQKNNQMKKTLSTIKEDIESNFLSKASSAIKSCENHMKTTKKLLEIEGI